VTRRTADETGSGRRVAEFADAALACLLLAAPATLRAAAPAFTVSVDLRAIATDAAPSFLDASFWGNDDRNPIGLTEAFVDYRPVPQGACRTRLRPGLFYAPGSPSACRRWPTSRGSKCRCATASTADAG